MGQMQNTIITSSNNLYLEALMQSYNFLRKYDMIVINVDFENLKFQERQIRLLHYPKLNNLLAFINGRDYSVMREIKGYELRINGYEELVNPINLSKFIGYHYLNDLEFQDEQVISANLLATKIIFIEANITLSTMENTDYRYVVGQSACTYPSSIRNGLNTYFDFLKYCQKLKSQNPYITIFKKERVFNELIPTTYLLVGNRPYIVFHQSSRCDFIQGERFKPKFEILDSFNTDPQNSVEKYENSILYKHNHTSITDLMNDLFDLPSSFIEDKKIIMSELNRIFKFDSDNIKLYYDWRKECYCFDRDIENMMFNDLALKTAENNMYYKYCSLDTLMAILNSGNFRLNSISTMNDPTESTKLISEGCNFKQNDAEILKETNNFFITSFTSLEDNLNMWRFYGDNAQGVCLKFEKKNNIEPDIFEINYCDLKCDTLEKINRFLDSLNEKNIRFCIQSYTETMLFVKPNDYRDEREKRLLIGDPNPTGYTVYSNKIVSPFIEKTLSTHKKSEENCGFPLKLTKITLGPELKNKELNKLQLEYLLENSPIWCGSVKVDVSKLECYRS